MGFQGFQHALKPDRRQRAGGETTGGLSWGILVVPAFLSAEV